jgi:hypothetical protein
MNRHALEVLEFPAVLDHVAGYAASSLGADAVRISIRPADESTLTPTLIGIPSLGDPGTGSWMLIVVALPLGIFRTALIITFSE